MLPISSAWRKLHQPRVYLTVEPVLLLFAFTSFLSYTVLQELLHHLVCQSTPNCTSTGTETHLNASTASSDAGKDGRCAVPGPIEQRVQTETSHWLLFINIATGVPAIFVSVFYGAISDLKGRRLFMILPALGSIVNLTTVLLVVYFRHTLPLAFLLVGAFALGVGGSFPVFNFAVFSYVSDISVASKRTIYISVLESMTFLGAAVSQLSGGPWVNNIHFTSPLYCIIAMDVVIILYVVVALPESVGVVQRQGCVANLSPRQPYHSTESSPGQQSPEQQEPISNGPQTCVLLKSSCVNLISFLKLLLRSWKLSSLLGMFLVVEINFLGITDTAVLFALGEPLCWGTELIGYFLAAKVFMNGVATLILLPLLSLVGFGDRVLMAVGLVSGGAGLLLMGSSTHTWMMFVVPVVAAMRGCVVPIIRSMLSKLTPSDMQGVLFSGVGVVEAACTLLASVIYNSLYPVTRAVYPGLIFYLMAAALLVPLTLLGVLELSHRRVCQSDRGEEGAPLLGDIQ